MDLQDVRATSRERVKARRRVRLVAGAIGLGSLAIALSAAPVLPQSGNIEAPADLRTTIDGTPADQDSTDQQQPATQKKPDPTRPGGLQRSKQIPSAGAGSTGFISTNTLRRRRGLPPNGTSRSPGLAQAPGGVSLPPELPDPLGSPSGVTAPPPLPPAIGTGLRPVSPLPVTGSTPLAVQDTGPLATAVSPPGTLKPRRRLVPDDDPFGALGIRAGSFVLRPAIEVWGGFDSNPARVPGGTGSPLIVISPELLARSDWERHELTAAIKGSYADYPAVPLGNRPTLDARVDGRIDASKDTRILLEGRYIIGTDYPGSPNLPAGIAKLPIFETVGGTLGVAQNFNRFDVVLKTTFDRTQWQPSLLTDGSTDSNADRNLDQYGAQLRASYELTPGLKPFIEVDADTRIHDLAIDRNGFARNSNGIAGQAGTAFELSRLLLGEVSIGYLSRLYNDPHLPDINGLIANGSLAWTATALTTARLAVRSAADESVIPGISGVFRRDTEIDIDHAFRRWLIATVRLGAGLDDYVGSDRQDHRWLASLGIVYKLTRSVQIKGELREEWLMSSVPGENYNAIVAMVGVRYQP